MVVSLFHLHVFFHCVWATLLWLNCPFASFTKWLWWVLHKCAHVNEQSEDKAGSVREKAIQTGDALNWDFDTGFFSCIISQGPPSHCVDQVATATALELNKETRSPDIPLLDNISTVKCRQRVRQQIQTLGCITPIHNWRASFKRTLSSSLCSQSQIRTSWSVDSAWSGHLLWRWSPIRSRQRRTLSFISYLGVSFVLAVEMIILSLVSSLLLFCFSISYIVVLRLWCDKCWYLSLWQWS